MNVISQTFCTFVHEFVGIDIKNMIKKSLKQYCSEIDLWDDWMNHYKKYVPLFIKEAATKVRWETWDEDVFKEFFERSSDQCVSSLKQGYFTKKEQQQIKDHWNELAPLLKKIADSQKQPQWEVYQEIKQWIRRFTSQDRKAATNRLIASLQPNLLCTIVNEYNLWELFKKLEIYTTEHIDFVGGNWFINSHNIFNLFQEVLQPQNAMDIVTYPWQILEHLKYIQEEQNNMSNYIEEKKELIEKNYNLILTGAPGTGKTHMAKVIAEAMEAEYDFVQFHPSYDYTDFVEGLRPTPPDNNGNIGFERKDGVFKSFCKKALNSKTLNVIDNFNERWDKLISLLDEQDFLQIPLLSGKSSFRLELNINGDGLANRTYENNDYTKDTWIHGMSKFFSKEQMYNVYRGLAGVPSGGHDNYRKAIIQYMIQNVGLLAYSKGTELFDSNKKFVFIIDEINRGEISKIFGELFFCIDPGYRGKKGLVKTQYQNLITDTTDPFYNGFYVPDNVYIIGTMNDIDRSVESMDFAMRRRFAWEEIKANENTGMLDELQEMKDEVAEVMKRLNATIWNEESNTGIEGLNAAYHIGGSYFCKLQLYLDEGHTNKESAYRHLWKNHLRGVLFEYLRGTANAMENLKMLESVYYNKNDNNDIEG